MICRRCNGTGRVSMTSENGQSHEECCIDCDGDGAFCRRCGESESRCDGFCEDDEMDEDESWDEDDDDFWDDGEDDYDSRYDDLEDHWDNTDPDSDY